jgi:hypothetical protein
MSAKKAKVVRKGHHKAAAAKRTIIKEDTAMDMVSVVSGEKPEHAVRAASQVEFIEVKISKAAVRGHKLNASEMKDLEDLSGRIIHRRAHA